MDSLQRRPEGHARGEGGSREGVARGESGLYVTLSETKEELRSVAATHGWSLDSIGVHELHVPEEQQTPGGNYTFFGGGAGGFPVHAPSVRQAVKR